MKSNNHQPKWDRVRLSPRIHTVKEISVHYEGRAEEVAIRPPDVSTHGMFFNTPIRFPEGTVLNLLSPCPDWRRDSHALRSPLLFARCWRWRGVHRHFAGVGPQNRTRSPTVQTPAASQKDL